jgi:hypothetical protein
MAQGEDEENVMYSIMYETTRRKEEGETMRGRWRNERSRRMGRASELDTMNEQNQKLRRSGPQVGCMKGGGGNSFRLG